jgi:polar amino acid transport system substrate-binding protein
MHEMLRAIMIAAAFLALAPVDGLRAQKGVPPDVVKELAPTGMLRAGINLGNSVLAQKSASGELGGVSVDLARELGKRLGVPVALVEFQAAGRSFAAVSAGETDVGFFAIEPQRAADVTFTPPYVLVEYTYMVAKDSPLKMVADVDKPGVRVGVSLNSAFDLYLTRTLKHATIIRAKVGGGQAAVDLFYAQKPDVAAGSRRILTMQAAKDPNVRVMDGYFQQVRQAMGTSKGREAAARYVRDFVEEMKKNGFVAAALQRSGLDQDAVVAPPATN